MDPVGRNGCKYVCTIMSAYLWDRRKSVGLQGNLIQFTFSSYVSQSKPQPTWTLPFCWITLKEQTGWLQHKTTTREQYDGEINCNIRLYVQMTHMPTKYVHISGCIKYISICACTCCKPIKNLNMNKSGLIMITIVLTFANQGRF